MLYALLRMTTSSSTDPTLIHLLTRRAVDEPEALAFDVKGERLSWDRLLLEARRAASVLMAHGAARGQPCGIALPTSVDFLAALFGAQYIGAIPVALNPRLPAAQFQRRARALGCSLMVCHEGLLASLEPDGIPAVGPDVLRAGSPAPRREPLAGPEDISHLQVTSGTTGEPRAVMLRHRNVMASVRAAREALDPSTRDVLVGWLPLHHDLGLVRFVFEPVYFGTPSYLLEAAMSALPTWLETITRVGGTITAAPDFAYRIVGRLVDPRRIDLQSLRIATNGGEVVRQSSIRAFEQLFGTPGVVQPGYGLAEATLGVALVRPGQPRRVDAAGTVSCGRTLGGVDVRITDEEGRPQRAGEPGRILVHGPTVSDGYWHDPEASAEILTDGWLDTGDVGSMDADGELYVRGRTRAMIKRAGATIAPREIEELVDELPGARRSAAVGVQADERAVTEDVYIVVEIERSVTARGREELTEAIAATIRRTLGFAPRGVRLVPPGAIPRTATGKTQYVELRRRLAEDGVG
jgi:acyl-CoA synthetase (AMP-forming)/AMP-acid ligase II